MKVKIDIDCTPDEASSLLGLPDVSRINEAMVDEVVRRTEANLESMEPEALMRQWSSIGGQMTNQFMEMMRQARSGPASGGACSFPVENSQEGEGSECDLGGFDVEAI